MDNIVILNKLVFLLFLLLPFLIYFLFFKKNKNISKIIKNKNKSKIIHKLLLVFIFVFFIVCFSNVAKTNYKTTEEKNGIDIVVALDLSLSMDATDLSPSRLESAKTVLNSFIDKITSDRVGLILFSRKAFTGIPLTFDYGIINETVSKLSTQSVSNNNPELMGTNIGDALLMADNLFESSEDEDNKRQKVILLITDGDSNNGVDPSLAAKYLAEKNVKIYSVGIGGENGGEITYYYNGYKYTEKIPPITPEKLINLSTITGGEAFFAYDDKTLEEIFKKLSELNKTKISLDKIVEYKYLNEYFYLFLMLLIFIFFLTNFYKINTK